MLSTDVTVTLTKQETEAVREAVRGEVGSGERTRRVLALDADSPDWKAAHKLAAKFREGGAELICEIEGTDGKGSR